MRGKGAENEKGEKELGITPAHAGKSLHLLLCVNRR